MCMCVYAVCEGVFVQLGLKGGAVSGCVEVFSFYRGGGGGGGG